MLFILLSTVNEVIQSKSYGGHSLPVQVKKTVFTTCHYYVEGQRRSCFTVAVVNVHSHFQFERSSSVLFALSKHSSQCRCNCLFFSLRDVILNTSMKIEVSTRMSQCDMSVKFVSDKTGFWCEECHLNPPSRLKVKRIQPYLSK